MYVYMWYPKAIGDSQFGRSLEGESALKHRNHFGFGEAALNHGNDFETIFDSVNHGDHFGIIFDSGPDPRSKILGRSSQGILDPVRARIIRIILELFLIRAGIQDPRFLRETSGQSWILDPNPNRK